jgi:hypothetical protein
METVAVKASMPRHLRRQAFAPFALRDMTFSAWVRPPLEYWLCEVGGSTEQASTEGALLEDDNRRGGGEARGG